MADPLLREDAILADLDRISTSKNAAQLKTGTRLAMLDAFDRRPDREAFCALLNEASSFQANLSRLELAQVIQTMIESGTEITVTVIEGVIKGLVEVCEEQRAKTVTLFRPITEMRLEADTLH